MTSKTSKKPRRMAREPQPRGNRATASAESSEDTNISAAMPSVGDQKPLTKSTVILGLLTRTQGATIDQLVEATGWLPHTTRAALTGLRKKGFEVTSAKAEGVRTYRVAKKLEVNELSHAQPSEGSGV